MKPTVGRIVHYKLSQQDAEAIASRRTTGNSIHSRMEAGTWPEGAQAHIGNPHQAGQIVPLLVVVVWPNEYGPDFDGVNGQAILDGNDTLWITSAREGTELGQWSWPERV